MGAILMTLALAGMHPSQTTVWGGEHIEIQMTAASATVEFDCAHGTIAETLRLDSTGAFKAKGTFVPERGGPSRDDGPPPLEATYSGSIKDGVMSLKIVVDGQDPKGITYQLTRDQRGNVRKCR